MEWTVTSPAPYVWTDGSRVVSTVVVQVTSGTKGHVSFQWVPMTYIAEMIEF